MPTKTPEDPSYGLDDGAADRQTFYAEHVEAGIMVDVNNKRCAHQSCSKKPVFGV